MTIVGTRLVVVVLVYTGRNHDFEFDYEPGRVGDDDGGQVLKKVVRAIYSYADYVNHTVWGRSL